MRSLEQDLYKLGERVLDHTYAGELYDALCNVIWRYGDRPGEPWSCSWRTAGAIVAELRGACTAGRKEGAIFEDYLDWYCSGSEGRISERVRAASTAALSTSGG